MFWRVSSQNGKMPCLESIASCCVIGLQKGDCRPFVIEGYQVGLIRPDMLKNLLKFPEVFHVQADAVELNPAFRDYDERTARMDSVLRECRDSNLFLPLKGWRDEVPNTSHLIIIAILSLRD